MICQAALQILKVSKSALVELFGVARLVLFGSMVLCCSVSVSILRV